ncbi:hypothetical protein L249_6698 [Ophiocordyceps polyrhachis-furcata BCC 54312]|uniref:Uncharacterized protein n=1 Tax=Ophiocordyceps polyrhachis-furcata BCC 54312 TaxID=1330021 RepID=A0A367LLH3_9HYPO|nr:hypothetical protein L249_6698 [Ophiocordyceps polyrhachis-furcata BCC 54312]
MSSPPPPPPPPHGEVPRSSGLPPGKYDIFVIPEHSAGAGFLYLPSLRPSSNSFAAGFASALILVALFQSMAPAFRAWWESFQGLGNMGITLLIAGVGFGAWALGRAQKDHPGSGYRSNGHPPGGGPQSAGGGFGVPPGQTGAGRPPHPPHGSSSSAPPPPPPQPKESDPRPADAAEDSAPPPPPPPRSDKPKPTRQRPPPQPATPKPDKAKGAWERAREEMRKKEEERKAREASDKRREEAQRRLAELRAKEAQERLERDEKSRMEKEAREKRERELAEEKKERDLAEEQQRQKQAAERLARERLDREVKEREDKASPSSYAYSAVGEKTNMWPNGRPTVAPSQAGSTASSPGVKRPPAPTAKTYVGTEDGSYSYRPYDRPQSGKKWRRRPSASSVGGSESSWAPSQTTTRTSPPPSVRGPYSTKDPDKIVIQAVYLFMNQFAKTPASQLVSGVGSVTDGLVLRMTTEGLFIDDDVRGVPQREWDVKAWTLQHVEAWCPPHCLKGATAAPAGSKNSPPHLLYKMATARRNAEKDRQLTGEDADAYLSEMLRACRECCRLGLCEKRFGHASIQTPSGQAGEWRDKGLHVLRATIRDQEAKRYLFVMDEVEGWKMAVGLQRLRRGTQVRQLGVSGMAPSEARGALEMLGWTG